MDWANVDGEEYERWEVGQLIEAGLVERCCDTQCPHEYHKAEGVTDADLLVTLERMREQAKPATGVDTQRNQ